LNHGNSKPTLGRAENFEPWKFNTWAAQTIPEQKIHKPIEIDEQSRAEQSSAEHRRKHRKPTNLWAAQSTGENTENTEMSRAQSRAEQSKASQTGAENLEAMETQNLCTAASICNFTTMAEQGRAENTKTVKSTKTHNMCRAEQSRAEQSRAENLKIHWNSELLVKSEQTKAAT
jgi:hypothetical protein